MSPNGDYGYEHARDAQWARDYSKYLEALLAISCLKMTKEGIDIPRIISRWWQKRDHAEQSRLVGVGIKLNEEMEEGNE